MSFNLVNILSVERTTLFAGRLLTGSGFLYTAPDESSVRIGQLVLVNTTDEPAVVSLHRIPYGAVAEPWNALVSGYEISAHDTVIMDFRQALDAGDSLAGRCNRPNAVNAVWAGEVYR